MRISDWSSDVCSSDLLAMEAGEAGADYVAFGAFFPTTTKTVEHHAEPEILEWWQGMFELPCVAIGGITVDNARKLIDAGADFLAVAGGVWAHPEGPAARSEEHTSELQSLMRISYAVCCLHKKK